MVIFPWLQKTALVAACLVCAASAVCFSGEAKVTQPMEHIYVRNQEQTMEVRLNESVQISLDENATTGFRWEIDSCNEQFIQVLATESHYAPNKIGAGGQAVFVFRGKKVGSGDVVLKHWRHWEGDSSIINRFFLHFNIQP